MGIFRAGRLARAGLVAAASGMLAAGMVAAGPARASVLACGTTITASVTLTQDMDCDGPGIIVGAAGVTVDLNGHKIRGPLPGDSGITDSHYNDVTVENGTIHNFSTAVEIGNRGGGEVTGVVVRNLTITNTIPTFTSSGITLENVTGALVTGNHITHPFGGGIDEGGNRNLWSDNHIDELGAEDPQNSLFGISLSQVTDDKIVANTISGTLSRQDLPLGDGIDLLTNRGTIIRDNTFETLSAGVFEFGDLGALSTGTQIIGNHGKDGFIGVQSVSGTDETFRGNVFSFEKHTGIRIIDPHHAVLTDNTTSHNTVDGIHIEGALPGSSARLNFNTAEGNGKYGLTSQFRVRGIGNIATGNAAADCVNVTCNQ